MHSIALKTNMCVLPKVSRRRSVAVSAGQMGLVNFVVGAVAVGVAADVGSTLYKHYQRRQAAKMVNADAEADMAVDVDVDAAVDVEAHMSEMESPLLPISFDIDNDTEYDCVDDE